METQIFPPLVVANWKMFNTVPEAIKLATTVHNVLGDNLSTELVVAPPATALYSLSVVLQDSPYKLAGQNCHQEEEGPYTGEVSSLFLKDLGCSYVILGHSERRQLFNESDELINSKIHTALGADLIPIFCIGETERERSSQKTFQVLESQLKKGLKEINMHDLEAFVIAYEPVWAIGTGHTATPVQIAEVHAFIRNTLARNYDAPTAEQVRILYGGSVKADNAKEIGQIEDVDGLLVGSASLNADSFIKIVHSQEKDKAVN